MENITVNNISNLLKAAKGKRVFAKVGKAATVIVTKETLKIAWEVQNWKSADILVTEAAVIITNVMEK